MNSFGFFCLLKIPRYKALTLAQCTAIEKDFRQYSREKTVGKATPDERTIPVESESSSKPVKLNYNNCKMVSPIEGKVLIRKN